MLDTIFFLLNNFY